MSNLELALSSMSQQVKLNVRSLHLQTLAVATFEVKDNGITSKSAGLDAIIKAATMFVYERL
jgi:hypothetical protein